MSFRKLLITMICLIAAAGMVFSAGASQQGTAAGAPIKLSIWGGIQPEYGYDTVVENFNREFRSRGVELEYIRYVNDNNGNLQLDIHLASGGDVDIFVGYGGLARFRPRVDSGLLMDLTDRLSQAGFDSFSELGEVNVRTWMVDERIYTLPAVFSNGQFWFANADRFREAGIPLPLNGWTQDEFRDALRRLTRGEGINKEYGMWWGVNWNSGYANGMINSMLGRYTVYKDDAMTETNYDHPLYLQGLQLIVDTMRNDRTAIALEDEIGDRIDFASAYITGRAAIAVDVVQLRIIKDIEAYPHNFTTAMIPAPVPSREYMNNWNHGIGAGGGSDYVCISSRTQYPREAFEAFLWYIQGGSFPLAMGGRLPLWGGVDRNLLADALLDGADGWFVRESIINYLNSINPVRAFSALSGPANAQIATAWREEMDAALLGRQTASQSVQNAKSRGDALIRSLR